MPSFKVFVSSTCYDLGMVRSELRSFISNLGHDPIMSEYNDILFDPKDHTHENCINEIANADAILLIIGSRFGGRAIPELIEKVNTELLKSSSKSSDFLAKNKDKISITQMEILKAIELNIPIYVFVDNKVLNDHLVYEKNKDKDFIDKIEFPAIDNRDTAIYIFEFINFLRLRTKNNSIFEYTKISDIEGILKKQWSAQLQRLLYDQRKNKTNGLKSDLFLEGIQDIKSLILSTINSNDGKEIGKGVLKYRKLIEFLQSFNYIDIYSCIKKNIQWNDLLTSIKIADVVEAEREVSRPSGRGNIYLIKDDGTYFLFRYPSRIYENIIQEWNAFRGLSDNLKRSITEAILESEINNIMPLLRYRDQNFQEKYGNDMSSLFTNNKDIYIRNIEHLNDDNGSDEDDNL